MLVSLYAVRVVLETLGAEDYGIYNVVAGVVTMFGFLSNSMATATQRYVSFELGRGDFEQTKKVFSTCLIIYLLIGILIVLLAETIGLWFVSNKLIIPNERMEVAQWIYQFSIFSFFLTIITTPYIASIIAHERMSIYAYVSALEAALKLIIVFILRFIPMDSLQLYGILFCIATFINTFVYRSICTYKFQECRFRFYWNKDLFKEIMSYTGWNLFGQIADILKKQGENILLNQFFNPVVVASRGIALSVNGHVSKFFQDFGTALRPQIIKAYAAGRKNEMLSLIFYGMKGTYFLMYFFTLPLILEMPTVLVLWLKNPPEYLVVFTRLSLIDTLIASIANSVIGTAVQATGKIKLYQSVIGGIILLNLPISWILLSKGTPAYSIFFVAIALGVISLIARLLIIKNLLDFPLKRFYKEILLPLLLVSLSSAIIPVSLCMILKPNFFRFCIVTLASILLISVCAYLIGLNSIERKKINNMILNKIGRK
jgi:O-antigen/teichoic acid export membrane protein